MLLTLSEQTLLFCYACLFGAALGGWCDLFRVVRLLFGQRKPVVFLCDLLFCVSGAIGVCLFFVCFCAGQVRLFVLVGEGGGFLLWRASVGELVFQLFSAVITALRHFFVRLFYRARKILCFFMKRKKKSEKIMRKN